MAAQRLTDAEPPKALVANVPIAATASAPKQEESAVSPKPRILQPRISAEENLEDQLETTAANVRQCLEAKLYFSPVSEQATVASWLEVFCRLAEKHAAVAATQNVYDDLGSLIAWFTEELLQHSAVLSILSVVVRPIVELQERQPMIFSRNALWQTLASMAALGTATSGDIKKDHLRPTQLDYLHQATLYRAFVDVRAAESFKKTKHNHAAALDSRLAQVLQLQPMLSAGSDEQKDLELVATLWGPSTERVKMKYLYGARERALQFREWDPKSPLLLLEPLFQKCTEFRNITTTAFVTMLSKHSEYADELPKIAHPVARQLGITWAKLTSGVPFDWCQRFFGELCQIKLATRGAYGEETPLPSVQDLLDVDDGMWSIVMKVKAARFVENVCLVHSVLDRAFAALEARRLSAGTLDDEAASNKKSEEAAIAAPGAASTAIQEESDRQQVSDAAASGASGSVQPTPVIEALEVGDAVEITMRKKEFNGRVGTVTHVKSGGKNTSCACLMMAPRSFSRQ